MRRAPYVAIALAIMLAGCAGSGIAPGDLLSPNKVSTANCNVTPDTGSSVHNDPPKDVLGWENGVWYNESITIDQSDGVSCRELELAVSRTMARLEHIRQLEFKKTPTAKIIPRKALRKQLQQRNNDVSTARRRFANAKYEALFLINESTNALAVQRRNRAASISGFYLPKENTLYLVADERSGPEVSSSLLAHELVHALQDQHFQNVAFPPIEDTSRAHKGVTEGDANYVEHLYEQRCNSQWLGTCLRPQESEERANSKSNANTGLANVGLYVLSYQPYSDGPVFVQRIRDRGGWSAVNDLYQNLPVSTEQTIHPELYPEDGTQQLGIPGEPDHGWSRITMKNQPDYETWGEAGLFTMFLSPSFESNGQFSIVSREAFLEPDKELDRYNYSTPASAGWDGDRFIAYQKNGELAYIWKIRFDSSTDARDFRQTYQRVLRFRDAHRVEGRSNVWRIPKGHPYADAFAVTRTGSTIRIVNAPTVEGLQAFDADGH